MSDKKVKMQSSRRTRTDSGAAGFAFKAAKNNKSAPKHERRAGDNRPRDNALREEKNAESITRRGEKNTENFDRRGEKNGENFNRRGERNAENFDRRGDRNAEGFDRRGERYAESIAAQRTPQNGARTPDRGELNIHAPAHAPQNGAPLPSSAPFDASRAQNPRTEPPFSASRAQNLRTDTPFSASRAQNLRTDAPFDASHAQNPRTSAPDTSPLPELLAPCGSPRALEAAIEGGADAVYLGGVRHNARALAQNFTPDDIRAAVKLAHLYGVRVYQTLNTLSTDRELSDVLEDARLAERAGVDALIVADLGVASAIHAALPDLPLHASTQASGHNLASAEKLAELGFCRMVCAREMSGEDIRRFTERSPIEAEVFVHGALCVCHSGQCLFSSMVGGRSGNRGECAQPCRLPYRVGGGECYPLSLKDLSLARHIPELIRAGVASLKLEGRMKSPEYVLAVTSVFRRLLDERRAATDDEMAYLASIFSRDGFTDGYFTSNIGSDMLGVRREEDKTASRALPVFTGLRRLIPVDITAQIQCDRPMRMTLSCGGHSVTVTGEVPERALKSPSEHDALLRNLTKLGGTHFCAHRAVLSLDSGLAVPVSRINALRRDAVAALSEKMDAAAAQRLDKIVPDTLQNAPDTTPGATDTLQSIPDTIPGTLDTLQSVPDTLQSVPVSPRGTRHPRLTAVLRSPSQLTPAARRFFDAIYLPPDLYTPEADGVVLPPVIFDHERDELARLLSEAVRRGATEALVGNLGHISLAREAGLRVHGDFRLNVTNSRTVAALEALGVADVIVSPELSLPRIRDLAGDISAIVYGRIPLMVLEKCVSRELSDCAACTRGTVSLTDRRCVSFPVLREFRHRNVIYNSLPTCMSDRGEELERAGILARHFIFSVETPAEVDDVIRAFTNGERLSGEIRRI